MTTSDGYLASELVARKSQDPQALTVCKLVVHSLQLLVILGGCTSFTRPVENETDMTPITKYQNVNKQLTNNWLTSGSINVIKIMGIFMV